MSVALNGLAFDSAAARAGRWRAAARAPAAQASAASTLAAVAHTRGRLAEARRFTTEARARRVEAGDVRPPLEEELEAARADLWLRERPAEAVARLDSLLAAHPVAALSTATDRRDALGIAALYAAAGAPAQARALVAAVAAATDSAERRVAAPERAEAVAEIALAEGRPADALAAFRQSDVAGDGGPAARCAMCVLPGLARAAERAGWADSARVVWERYVTTPALDRGASDRWHLARAYRRLGALYTEAGDLGKATEYDERFVALWARADAELQPQVAAVRQRLVSRPQRATEAGSAPPR